MIPVIERFCTDPVAGTFGRLLLNDVRHAFSIEQPWRNNEPFRSCVPAGIYDLVPFLSKTKYPHETYALVNEELGVYLNDQCDGVSRYACLLHSANLAAELQGCIGFGSGRSRFGVKAIPADWAVTSSKNTTKIIIDLIRKSRVKQIEIRGDGVTYNVE